MITEIKPLQVLTKDGRHTAGFISGRVFRKQLQLRNHLNTPPGWTLDDEFLVYGKPVKWQDLKRYGVAVIQIHVTDMPSPSLLVASLDTFILEGVDINRGTGTHRALADGFWKRLEFYRI